MRAAVARRDSTSEARPAPVLDGAAVAVGLGLLLARPWVASLAFAPIVLLALYAAVVYVSWDGSATLGAPRRWWPALLVGLGAVAVARVAVQIGPPTPRTWWVLPLGIAAAIAEEALFRGLLYRVLAHGGAVVAVVGTAVAFAALHVPSYGIAAFWVDLGAGLLLSWQRWASGGWGVPAATHVFANLLVVVP